MAHPDIYPGFFFYIYNMTLIEIKNMLLNWFNNHPQINTVAWGSLSDFAGKKDKEYTAANIEYLNSNLTAKQLQHSYSVTIGDRIDPNYPELEDVVVSDTMQISEDFFAYLSGLNEVTFNTNVNIQPFTDDVPDRLSGVTFRVVLSVARKITDCDKPN